MQYDTKRAPTDTRKEGCQYELRDTKENTEIGKAISASSAS